MLEEELALVEDFDDSEFDDDDDILGALDVEYDDDDDVEYDDDDALLDSEDAERRRRRKRRRAPARGKGYFKQRLPKNAVTQTQLRSALGRVSKDVRRNALAIRSVNSRVSAVGKRIHRTEKVNRKQAQDIVAVKKDVDQSRQMFMLTALLGGGKKSYVVESEGSEGGKKTIELAPKDGKLDTLLPLLLMGGMSGSTGSAGGLGDPLMMVLLLDALGD